MKKYAVMEIIEEVENFTKEMNKKHPGRNIEGKVSTDINAEGIEDTKIVIFHTSREAGEYCIGSSQRMFIYKVGDLNHKQNTLRRMNCEAYLDWKKRKKRILRGELDGGKTRNI